MYNPRMLSVFSVSAHTPTAFLLYFNKVESYWHLLAFQQLQLFHWGMVCPQGGKCRKVRNSVLSASSGSADNIHPQLVAFAKHPCPNKPMEEGMARFSVCSPCPCPLKAQWPWSARRERGQPLSASACTDRSFWVTFQILIHSLQS